ncbi:hypothetical protein GPECTOR_2g1386 [Gonium pectorale]|uniref:DNA 3'-5' helicase n=1 Tax=Gonium pectorale TaxID=33097 RepID=A0A150H187_GONPE|nr:hypothetical protein GPECTOR_2g1386 [Gonium pectorale]|eukprot:KXZ55835.1 hypothetical protein GPECTOR_2g1386 [Gonium pectorale]
MDSDDGIDLTGPDPEQEAAPLQQQLDAVEDELDEVKSQLEYLMQRQDLLRSRRDQLLRRIEQERRAPRADWQQETFPWSQRLGQALRDVFGLREFRPLQREVMNATLQGRDVLVLLPSGGGKSLCYQLPALVGPPGGMTLVVSPLLSLIQDQVLSLRALGLGGCALTSLSSKEEVAEVYSKMDRGEVQLLYVTPEKIVSSKRFMSKLEKVHQAGRLARIAIDEAHCASQWGNDFRPVCEDLKTILRIGGCEFFRASVNRPNLFYEVRPKPAAAADATAAIVAWVQQHYPAGESGIVYCLTRKDCETVAAELVAGGLTARHYHADMEPGPREAAHAAWSAGRVQVMVATVAFGMGINKPDVRFVVHHSLSKSLENYYQESGRAGRDSRPARCLMFYRFSDALRQAAIVCFEPSWQTNLAAIMNYAAASPGAAQQGAPAAGGAGGGGGGCRRAIIQRHFAEAPAECRCMCDNCCAAAAGPLPPARDVSRHAAAVLAILRQQQAKEKKATLIQLVDLWRGSKETGVGKEAKAMSKDENEAVIAAMMYSGLLQFEFGHTAYATNTYLKATPKGLQLLEAAEKGAPQQLHLLLPATAADAAAAPGAAAAAGASSSRKKTKAAAAASVAAGAYGERGDGAGEQASAAQAPQAAALERWRCARARALGVFPHSVLSAEQLGALAALPVPAGEDALRAAVGARRYELYGGELEAVLAGRWAPGPEDAGAEVDGEGGGAGERAPGGPTGGTRAAGSRPGPGSGAGEAAAGQRRQQQKPAPVARGGLEVVVLDDSEDDAGHEGAVGAVAPRPRSAAAASGPGRGGGAVRRDGRGVGSGEGDVESDLEGDEGDRGDDDDFVADLPQSKRRRGT